MARIRDGMIYSLRADTGHVTTTLDIRTPIPVKLSPHDFQFGNGVSGDNANDEVDHEQYMIITHFTII